LRLGWNLGEKVTVDESMIKYMGWAITWIQYMPKKPIKHGIKVFAMCCAATGYLYGFEVYTGKEYTTDGSAVGVITRLIESARLQNAGTGQIFYTDNWYTSIELMIHLWARFGFFIGGYNCANQKESQNCK